jgi:beta-lactamase superfamily II metal-dependent hydrolase
LRAGDHAAFDLFRAEGVDFRVLGPIEDDVGGTPALQVLRDDDNSQSASHTINGHSVVLKLVYGNVSFLLGGDLNIDGSEKLLAATSVTDLRSDVLKVPHHGSAEFSPAFLHAVAPVVSVVSSGDENRAKEYVHPRANLMAALGKFSRSDRPLLFTTELALQGLIEILW